MKNIMRSFSVIALGAVLALASCTEDNGMGPSPVVDGAFIHSSLGNATVDVTSNAPQFVVPIMRTNKSGALTVQLEWTSENMAILSNPPVSASFADGQDRVDLTIPVNTDLLEFGKPVELGIALKGNDASPYGLSAATMSIVKPLIWEETAGVAKYTASMFAALFGIDPVWYVKYQKAEGLEIYRLVNAYGVKAEYGGFTVGCPNAVPASIVGTKDNYIIIDASDPNAVTIAQQSIGADWGYGEMEIGAAALRNNTAFSFGKKVGNTISICNFIKDDDGYYASASLMDVIEFGIKAAIIPEAPDADPSDAKKWGKGGSGTFMSNFVYDLTDSKTAVSAVVKVERQLDEDDEGTQYFRIANCYKALMPNHSFKGDYDLYFQIDMTTYEPIAGSIDAKAIGCYYYLDAETFAPIYIENATMVKKDKYYYTITADFYFEDDDNGKVSIGTYSESFFWNDIPADF